MKGRSNEMFLLGSSLSLLMALSFAKGMETTPDVTPKSSILSGKPYLKDSMSAPVHVVEGESAPLTCVVRNLGNSTVVWKKWENGKSGSKKILTAGETRITADERVRVIHDKGGDVWVLAIQSSIPSDSGLYICEVNTEPILQSFHNLTVISLQIQPPNSSFSVPLAEGGDIPFEGDYSSYKGQGSIMSHNYTGCCQKMKVSHDCLGFCTLQSILEGNTGDPSNCENEFPNIVKCMADGRDHQGCCIREGVPDICQDLCRGEYTTVTDNVKTHFSCPTYIERTLSCIADGIEILPSYPQDINAVALNSTAINVSWSIPAENGDTITEYVVNVTTLRSFDAPHVGADGYGIEDPSPAPQTDFREREGFPFIHAREPGKPEESPRDMIAPRTDPKHTQLTAEDKVEASMMQIKVDYELRSTVILDLKPFTMYEISVRAFNIHGGSLPTYKLRVLTLPPGSERPKAEKAPDLPDIRSCCVKRGVTSDTCVNKLCDPKMATSLEIPDLMICAPWTPDVFACLADGKDHTPCCRQRGIGSPCQELCSGNITKLDYHYFKCLRYMNEYANCLMEGYGVLPSPPRQVRVSNVQEDFAIVHWTPPDTLVDTITGYNIHFRPLATFESEYHIARDVHPPFILEGLYNNAEYEVYVEAVNEHGASQGSPRVVFRTADQHEELDVLEKETIAYNETGCCVKAGMSEQCLPLCSYDASMSDIRSLALVCAPEFHTLLRCAAGGRDHSQCCSRRGVSDNCVPICTGQVQDSLISLAETCLPFIGNIVQCFEEGTGLIPGPVVDFHATHVSDSSVSLAWEPPTHSNVSSYEIYYHLADPTSLDLTFHPESINVSEPYAEVGNLTKNAIYQFYISSKNEHGSSIPSAMILVNVSSSAFNGTEIPGVLSSPHSLVVASHSATYVQIVWQPPLFAHPEDKITYKVYHRGVKEQGYNVTDSYVNSITLEDLSPNSQYIVYVTASNDKGESPPSETLIAWADPAHSPFVEAPRIQPINMLVEGKSMTVFCVALGDPTPTISLFINGRLIKTEKNRHLTQTIESVTRDMEIVSCFADNGYGTPMQAARKIQVSYGPSIHGSEVNLASLGESAIIQCTVNAFPDPKVVFWKSEKERIPIVMGSKYQIEQDDDAKIETRNKHIYKLKISNVTQDDIGSYFCHAENHFGDETKAFTLQIRKPQDLTGNITQCCVENKVSPKCMDACGFYLDIESVIDRAECLGDFDKLMKCAADSRDHRSCCSSWGVPRRCLDWCRGEPLLQNGELCVLQSTKAILQCFQENKDLLPGPPQKLRFDVLSESEVRISWDPPVINPQAALIYRTFWRVLNSKTSEKVDTQGTSVRISNLKLDTTYEAFVKAGNHHGTSVLSEQILFTTQDNTISSARSAGGSGAGLGVGLAFLFLAIIGGIVGGVWFVRKRSFGAKPNGAIAFENPSYIRESNPDSNSLTNGEVSNNGGVSSVSNRSNGSVVPAPSGAGARVNGWHTETLEPPRTESEVPPTFYEELRLGSDGAGFRRLK